MMMMIRLKAISRNWNQSCAFRLCVLTQIPFCGTFVVLKIFTTNNWTVRLKTTATPCRWAKLLYTSRFWKRKNCDLKSSLLNSTDRHYLDGFLLSLARTASVSIVTVAMLLLLLLLADVHRPKQIFHLLHFEVVSQSGDTRGRQSCQLATCRTRQLAYATRHVQCLVVSF